MTAVVAAHDPPGPAKLRAVVAGHRVPVGAEQAVHADAVAAMVLSRAVAVAATAEVQADMGAAPRGSEEDQISRSQRPTASGATATGWQCRSCW